MNRDSVGRPDVANAGRTCKAARKTCKGPGLSPARTRENRNTAAVPRYTSQQNKNVYFASEVDYSEREIRTDNVYQER